VGNLSGFTLLRHVTPKMPSHRDLESFVQLKKAVAVLLLVVLVTLAFANLASWAGLVERLPMLLAPPPIDVDLFFFPRFFEFMIFTDVFLLIVSLAYYDRYEHVFRNAGFVISTVLLRVSLSTPKPYDVALALIAMLYGLAVLGVFTCFATLEQRRFRERDARPGGPPMPKPD
jgi:hypothetical protein